MLSRVYYTAEVSEKIINLNSNEAEIKDQIGVLLQRAIGLDEKVSELKQIQEKIKNGQEVHRLIENVNKLVKSKSKTLPEYETLAQEVRNLEQAKAKMDSIPNKKEVLQINTLKKQAEALDEEIAELLKKKLVSQKPAKTSVKTESEFNKTKGTGK